MQSYIHYMDVDVTGSIIAFGADKKRQRMLDLFIMEMQNGVVKPTKLLDRVRKNAEFRLR